MSLRHTQPLRSAHSLRLSVTHSPNALPHSLSLSVTHRPNAPHLLSISLSHNALPHRTFSPSLGHTKSHRSASFCQSLRLTWPDRSAFSLHLSVTHNPTAPLILSVSRSHTTPPLRTFCPSLGHTHPHQSVSFSQSLGHTEPHRSAHSLRLSVTHSSTAPLRTFCLFNTKKRLIKSTTKFKNINFFRAIKSRNYKGSEGMSTFL